MCNANYQDVQPLVKSMWRLVLFLSLVITIALLFLISKLWRTKFSLVEDNDAKGESNTLNTKVSAKTKAELLFPILENEPVKVNMNGYVVEEILHYSGKFAINYTLVRTSTALEDGPPKLVMKKYLGSHQNLFFATEKSVYELLDQSSACFQSFLKFYGGYEQIPINGVMHYQLLSLEHVPGTLDQVMQSQTINWTQLTQMLLDLSRGLGNNFAKCQLSFA